MIDWPDYERRFRAAVMFADRRHRYDEQYAERCLAYARPLVSRKLPIIYDQYHLSKLVGYSVHYLYGVANSPSRFYRSYEIPKVAGGTRRITEPLPSLKEIQRWILDNILSALPIHPFAKGFVVGRSIRENARFHQRQPMVITVDIEEFFGSVQFPKVLAVFFDLGYAPRVAVLLARLCVLDDSLPQGAPTSPALSNLVSEVIDRRLSSYARRRNIRYTRYADDMTFSGNFEVGTLYRFVEKVLREDGFRLNVSKTRLMQRHQRQETTGVVVNEKLQVPREVRRSVRQACWYINKFGLEAHLSNTRNVRANYLRHLLGVVGYVLFINPADRDGIQALSLLSPLLKSE